KPSTEVNVGAKPFSSERISPEPIAPARFGVERKERLTFGDDARHVPARVVPDVAPRRRSASERETDAKPCENVFRKGGIVDPEDPRRGEGRRAARRRAGKRFVDVSRRSTPGSRVVTGKIIVRLGALRADVGAAHEPDVLSHVEAEPILRVTLAGFRSAFD